LQLPTTPLKSGSADGCRDRAEGDTILLTQEFLSEMLGVRRTSATEVAIKIEAGGAISYSRSSKYSTLTH